MSCSWIKNIICWTSNNLPPEMNASWLFFFFLSRLYCLPFSASVWMVDSHTRTLMKRKNLTLAHLLIYGIRLPSLHCEATAGLTWAIKASVRPSQSKTSEGCYAEMTLKQSEFWKIDSIKWRKIHAEARAVLYINNGWIQKEPTYVFVKGKHLA